MSSHPLSLGALTSTFSAPAGIVSLASVWCLGELPLSFSSSIFVTYVLSTSSFGLEFIADDPPALQQSVAGVATFSDGPALLLLLQSTGNVASVMICTLRAFSLFGRLPRPPVTSSVFRYLVTLVRVCSPLQLHPAPCPRGYLSWLSALVTPPMAFP